MSGESTVAVLLRQGIHISRGASLDSIALDAFLRRDAPAIVDTCGDFSD